ncbi:MAG: hypothetical protein ACKVU0_18760 [Saprospiraceae bacterium]
MKFIKSIIPVLVSFFLIGNSNAQTVYGTYDSATGNASVTATSTSLTQKFRNSLNDQGAQISDFRFITYPDGNNFLLVALVGNSSNNIRSVGIEMVPGPGGTILARSGGPGPTVEYLHSCTGNPCENCELKININTMPPDVFCRCQWQGTCNHTVQATIGWK